MKKIIFVSLSVIILMFGCSKETIIEPTEIPDNNNPDIYFSEKDVLKGRIRIKLKEEPTGEIAVRSSGRKVSTGIEILDSSASALGITRIERTFPDAGQFEERSRKKGMHLWYDIWFSGEAVATRAADDISSLEGIEVATPVLKVVSSALPPSPFEDTYTLFSAPGTKSSFSFNDPSFSQQWSFYNPGSESWQISGADIRLSEVWDQYNGHPDIIVAIVDGGVTIEHPDLEANLWINKKEIPGNGIDDDGNGYIDDVYGYNFVEDNSTITPHRHGTHVAGTIAAVNNNGIGVSGIAGGNGSPDSGAKLMSCQIFQHTDLPYENMDEIAPNIAAGIKYGADNGAVISQNSWGYAADTRSSYIDPAHKAAIDYFVEYAGCDNNGNQLPGSPMKGGIVLFASGNANSSNPRIGAPADYEKVLGVAAIGPDYKKPTYSNYGDYIAISAPGGGSNGDQRIYSTTTPNRNYYEYRYGTSMSCPHVAGVAALIIQKHGVGKQGFTVSQLEEILLSTAYDLDSYNPEYVGELGAGCVNAAAALKAELSSSNPFTLLSNPVTNNILSFRVNVQLTGHAIITIYNSTGAKVLRQSIETKRFTPYPLDITELATGYYSLEYECNGKKVKEKFIKY